MSFLFETATRYGAVTKSDTTALKFKALYVGGTGSVVVQRGAGDETAVTFAGVPAGAVLYVTGNRVMAATSATNIVWLDW